MLRHFQASDLSTPSHWIGEKPKEDEFFDIDRSYYTRSPIPFQPFAQKVEIPAGSTLIFHGDFHGDIRSFISTLVWLNRNDYMEGFQLKKPDTYFVFLGDYVDRGSYGVEVLYTLMRLKLENPDHVLIARGNHEDFKMTATYGFLREGQMKYGRMFDPLALWRVYDFLPVVIYVGVGTDYVQCNHGGMEPGYDPKRLLMEPGKVRYQLLRELQQKTFAKKHPQWLRNASQATLAMAEEKLADFRPTSPVDPNPIGFMWNDFFVFRDDPTIGFNAARLAFNHGQASDELSIEGRKFESRETEGRVSRSPAFECSQSGDEPNRGIEWRPFDTGKRRTRSTVPTTPKRHCVRYWSRQPRRSVPEGSVWTLQRVARQHLRRGQ